MLCREAGKGRLCKYASHIGLGLARLKPTAPLRSRRMVCSRLNRPSSLMAVKRTPGVPVAAEKTAAALAAVVLAAGAAVRVGPLVAAGTAAPAVAV